MSALSGVPRPRRLLTIATLVAVTGLSLAACSSKPSGTPAGSNNSGTTTTSSSSGTTGTSTSSTTSSGSSATSKLAALTQEVQNAKGGTFKLTYSESSTAAGGSHSLTFEQMPPKFLFSLSGTGAALVVNTGTTTYTCSNASGHSVCYSFGASDPFAPLLGILTGATTLTAFRSLESGLAGKLAGVSATFSNQTFAGQSAQCVSGVKGADTFKYCITQSGVLAYAGGSTATGGGALTLTAYSTSASAGDFALPAGATVVTS